MFKMRPGKHGTRRDRARIEGFRKSIVGAYCRNPRIEFLPGQLIAGPFMHPDPKPPGAEEG
jgi:hypothetical protein